MTDDASSNDVSPEDLAWAEGWLAESKKPSRQRNLTPEQRQQLAYLYRMLRRDYFEEKRGVPRSIRERDVRWIS
jgi:Spy/CpxP family protein refolding chaperone